MKKAKMMLIATAVLVIVGTALAFKVKKFGVDSYCWIEGTSQPDPGACIKSVTESGADSRVFGTQFYYTTTTDATKCASSPNLTCPNTAKLPWGD